MESIVKSFNKKRGYGFIVNYNSEEEIFVHYSEIQDPGYKLLKENQLVSFDLIRTENGYKAINVTVIKDV